MTQKIIYDEKTHKCYLVTKYNEHYLTSVEITVEEAAQWEAENGY